MLVYLTAEEVYGANPPVHHAGQALRQVPLEAVLEFAAFWLTKLHRPGADRREVDREFVTGWFQPPVRDRLPQPAPRP